VQQYQNSRILATSIRNEQISYPERKYSVAQTSKHSRCKNKVIMSMQFNLKPKYGNYLQLLSSKLFLCLSLFISSHFIYTRHNTSMMLSYYPPVTLTTNKEKNATLLLALSVTVWSGRAK
jgi:hypothetical protein